MMDVFRFPLAFVLFRKAKTVRSILPYFFAAPLFCLSTCTAVNTEETLRRPAPEKKPSEELASFKLEPGLKIQLVASEPMVEDPVVITFDEDGRLWVVEMRGFMPNIDGEGERAPLGRVSVLEDTDGDGTMDASKIYLDSLVLPRAIALIPGGALVVEKETLWLTQDLDHDLHADTKILIDADYAGSDLPEHSGNGLLRGLDNWYYNAKSRLRYRPVAGRWRRDSTEFRGQWGISQDDAGHLFYNYNWSQLHADLVPPNYMSRNKHHTPTTGIDHGLTIDRRVYPIRPTPAVNRGYIPGTLNEQGRLQEFTAACSPLVYRGTALPKEFYSNAFVCEPSGNLIKRNLIESAGLLLSARDPHPGTEFMASTDERFRPVFLATGPDGALYVADMYRGLIQHKAYVTPYLREQTLSRKLDQPVHRGRIWRIVPADWQGAKPDKLSHASAAGLIGYLSHPDGWYRDMAQRLLVERGDKSVRKSLMDLVLSSGDNPGRIHALWTLEGLDLLDPEALLQLLTDENHLVRTTTLRLLEPFVRADKKIRAKLEAILLEETERAPAAEALQIAFTAKILDWKVSSQLLQEIANRYDTSALVRDAILSSIEDQEFSFLHTLLASPEWRNQKPAREIFIEMLSASIVRKRDPGELRALLAILDTDSTNFSWRERSILTGMSIQGNTGKVNPVKLSAAPGILRRRGVGVSAVYLQGLAAIFEWPGSVSAEKDLEKKNPLTEKEKQQFAMGRKFYLSTCSACHGNDGEGLNRFAPPLKGSEWVMGDEKRLALIVLHGLEGALEVRGKVYDKPEILPVMPSHSTMDDGAIAAILTYIRNEWGNEGEAVTSRAVGNLRLTTQGRVIPWTAAELNKHVAEISQ
jgi:mono/diheme cytochrome c family protein/glucose/arabinose dehydrogenase